MGEVFEARGPRAIGVRRWVPIDLRRYVPSCSAQAVPDPPNAWDMRVLDGDDAEEIALLLSELAMIAEVDWAWRHLHKRRDDVFVRLATLGITVGRMQRNYAIDGKTIISHPSVGSVLRRYGIEPGYQEKQRSAATQTPQEDM